MISCRMRNSLFVGLLVASCAAPAIVSCDGETADSPAADGGVVDGAPGSGGDATVGTGTSDAAVDTGPPPPVASPFGLDTRPSNATCVVPERPVLDTGVKAAPAFGAIKFQQPVGLFQAPGDPSRFFVIEKAGGIRVFPATATAQADVKDFIVLPATLINSASEGGLLGMAFSPDWATNHEVYLSYTTFSATAPNGSNMKSIIARYKSLDNGLTLDSKADVLLTLEQPYTNHDGGNIAFGPDGYLYAGFGDGGSGGDPNGNGQNKNVLLGKMLRIDVRGKAAGKYDIPPTNPFAAGGGRGEVYAYGLRNPWRWSFDRGTGDLWVGDVGQNTYEEIDRLQIGGNYGWNTREGLHCYNAATCATAGFIDPIVEHGRDEAQSITGGYVYRGSAIPSLVGTYLHGDYQTGNVWAIVYDAAAKASSKLLFNIGAGQLSSFGEGLDGELYMAFIASGGFSKIVPAAAQAPSAFPTLLSKTGCVDASDATKPSAGLVPYEVNSPLWSDAAQKDRYMALPDGAKITVGADGDWDFPKGSVLMKTFVLGGKRIETRLFMRHSDGGWAGYTYEWNDAQTDATLLPAAKTKTVGTATWTYPSRSQCVQCHTAAAGGTLGLETAQLNRNAVYASTNRLSDQLTTLDHIGLFVAAPTADGGVLAKMPTPLDATTGDLQDRARAYLHSNCSHCHRPSGGGQGTMDLRYAGSFAATKTCNAAQTQGTLGTTDAKLLFPGAPAKSVIAIRMHATDANRMPPIASNVPDTEGTKLIEDWITSVTACP